MDDPARPKAPAWPFEEAQKIAARVPADRVALFETGYGPSGLPHIGTFGEVARTSWVRRAYQTLTGRPSRLIAFSDDMDGLRKVPDNVPNRDLLAAHLGQPLTRVPDPFGTHASFGAHNNDRLKSFLDAFGFNYEFVSATDHYRAGHFNPALRRVLATYQEIVAAVLPTLGPDRRATYSPILPLHPITGQVMQVAIDAIDADAATVTWRDPSTGQSHETSVLSGGCKLQWKADWAMRWYALGIDYEMSGKDLIDSVKLSGKICRILGAAPPIGYTYELFLDEQGQKISKSKGNGLSVEQWLRYAPAESLSQFMFNAPARAKRLHFDVIPRAVDDFLANATKLQTQPEADRHANPAWFIGGAEAAADTPLTFAMLLNLASAVNAENADILWGFIARYAPGTTPENAPYLARLADHAVAYFQDFVQPKKIFRPPTDPERAALAALAEALANLPATASAEEIQNTVFAIGNAHAFTELRAWFGCLYQVLLGQTEGPRFGHFAAIYGLPDTVALIDAALDRTWTAKEGQGALRPGPPLGGDPPNPHSSASDAAVEPPRRSRTNGGLGGLPPAGSRGSAPGLPSPVKCD